MLFGSKSPVPRHRRHPGVRSPRPAGFAGCAYRLRAANSEEGMQQVHGRRPDFCTIIASSFQALKKAKVLYYSPTLGSNGQFVSSDMCSMTGRAAQRSGIALSISPPGPPECARSPRGTVPWPGSGPW